MCGIAGYFHSEPTNNSAKALLRMVRSIKHRGPDDEGLVLIRSELSESVDLRTNDTDPRFLGGVSAESVDKQVHNIAFGHVRFSITDLSVGGHQPFWSKNRKVCVVLNGEIYNYKELRNELRGIGHEFHTASDTEVLVEAYRAWGVDCFKRFIGFWALSLYDDDRKSVLLSRDRVGKAPLYVTKTPKGIWWCSEIKGLFAGLDKATFEINKQSVFNYVHSGKRDLLHKTFYKAIETFPNASYAWISRDGSFVPEKYWELPSNRLSEREISTDEAINQFRGILTESVNLRQKADVSVCFTLSGGMDSTSIIALALQSEERIKAFTISHPGEPCDEEPLARKVAEFYNGKIDYNPIKPTSDEFFDEADSFVWLLGEPFHNPNLHSHFKMMQRIAETGSRVAINGSGGDETLAGYLHYHNMFVTKLLKEKRYFRAGAELVLSDMKVRKLILRYNPAKHCVAFINNLFTTKSKNGARIFDNPFIKPDGVTAPQGPSNDIDSILQSNIGDWLMNYWMRSGNQTNMGVPIETRLPFLDHRVVEFLFLLPISYLIRNGFHKWVLRKAVNGMLPRSINWRKSKVGFPFPKRIWFPANKDRFFSTVGNLDCEFINMKKLHAAYDSYATHNTPYLWRIMSLALWWKRCVLNERLI